MPGIDDYTVLMLHCDGADESTSFPDNSDSGHTVTAHGDAQVDTAIKKYGTGAGLLDGTGDYLSIPDSSDWAFGSDDFTIDFWLYVNDYSGATRFGCISQGFDTAATNILLTTIYPSTYGTSASRKRFRVEVRKATIYEVDLFGTTQLNTGQWYHIAIVRNGSNWYLFLDGVLDASDTYAGDYPDISDEFEIGRTRSDYAEFDGWIDEFRVSKGIARWTENFTPPTEQYTRDFWTGLDVLRRWRGLAATGLDPLRAWTRETRITGLDARRRYRGVVLGGLDTHRRYRGAAVAGLDVHRRWRGRVFGGLDPRRRWRGRVLSGLDVDREHMTHTGWAIYVDGAYEGFIAGDGDPLNLAGISLGDGGHYIEARPCGELWRRCRYPVYFRCTVSGGDIVAAVPPAVRSLRADDLTDWGRRILWTWLDDFGTTTPADFALWFADASPVSTAGDPDATVTAQGAGRTHVYLYAQAAAKYVAVCAREADETQGPATELYLDYPSGSITGPASQWAEEHV